MKLSFYWVHEEKCGVWKHRITFLGKSEQARQSEEYFVILFIITPFTR